MKKFVILVICVLGFAAYAQEGHRISSGQGGRFQAWQMFGFNADLGNSQETVWDQGGLYSYPTSATTGTVSSDSSDDTSAGTGARTVKLYCTNSSDQAVEQIITLSGTTGVDTTTACWRVNRLEVVTAGSGAANAGAIYYGTGTVTAGVPANVYISAITGYGRSMNGFYHVPANERAMLKNLTIVSAATSSGTVTIELVGRATGGAFNTFKRFLVDSGVAPVHIVNDPPLFFGPSTDIEVRGTASGADVDVSVDANFITIK